ncbi:hypothetical protein NL676_005343 [Syzygium grande]|nr:hypothetical protein NL676_005343 [Syzygium grande]
MWIQVMENDVVCIQRPTGASIYTEAGRRYSQLVHIRCLFSAPVEYLAITNHHQEQMEFQIRKTSAVALGSGQEK